MRSKIILIAAICLSAGILSCRTVKKASGSSEIEHQEQIHQSSSSTVEITRIADTLIQVKGDSLQLNLQLNEIPIDREISTGSGQSMRITYDPKSKKLQAKAVQAGRQIPVKIQEKIKGSQDHKADIKTKDKNKQESSSNSSSGMPWYVYLIAFLIICGAANLIIR